MSFLGLVAVLFTRCRAVGLQRVRFVEMAFFLHRVDSYSTTSSIMSRYFGESDMSLSLSIERFKSRKTQNIRDWMSQSRPPIFFSTAEHHELQRTSCCSSIWKQIAEEKVGKSSLLRSARPLRPIFFCVGECITHFKRQASSTMLARTSRS